ncbi:MAG: NRDE family protein [Halanaeroarchaeum sp.]
MCTILFAFQEFSDAPLAVAANRDESPDRPSSPPAVTEGDPSVLAPRDERAGGTWMGINEHRVFAIVANRWTDRSLEATRSRGLLVRDILEADSVGAAVEVVRTETAAEEYAGFSVLVSTPAEARVLIWDGVLREEGVAPGVHVLVNVGYDGAYDVPRSRRDVGEEQADAAERIREVLSPREGETGGGWVERARDVLADHEYGACVHRERYQTVSASTVTVDADGDVTWQYADGPPCSTDHRPVDGQI